MSYRFVDSFRAGPRRNSLVPSWSCSKAVYKPVWHIPLLSVQWINSWWWTDKLSETWKVSCQNKFVKLVHLVGFITKKFTEVIAVFLSPSRKCCRTLKWGMTNFFCLHCKSLFKIISHLSLVTILQLLLTHYWSCIVCPKMVHIFPHCECQEVWKHVITTPCVVYVPCLTKPNNA